MKNLVCWVGGEEVEQGEMGKDVNEVLIEQGAIKRPKYPRKNSHVTGTWSIPSILTENWTASSTLHAH